MQKRLRKETTDSWTGYNCDREYYCPVIIIFTQESVKRTGSEDENRENDMLNQFSRTQLLLGEEAMERLKNSRVAVLVSAVSADMSVRHWCEAVSEPLI